MRNYRNSIKDPVIVEVGISPDEYKRLMGPQSPYNHDEADGVIIRIAGDVLEKHSKILQVFWLLYSCKSYSIVQKELSEPDEDDKPHPIRNETVRKYSRIAKKSVIDLIEKNERAKKQIKEAITREFEIAKRKPS